METEKTMQIEIDSLKVKVDEQGKNQGEIGTNLDAERKQTRMLEGEVKVMEEKVKGLEDKVKGMEDENSGLKVKVDE